MSAEDVTLAKTAAAHGSCAPPLTGSEIAGGGDAVNHPAHYTAHPSGVECIQVTEHMSFCLGNAVKYIWRADLKHDAIEDLRKAQWYLAREIERRGRHSPNGELCDRGAEPGKTEDK